MRVGSTVVETVNPAVVRPWYEVVQETLKRNDVKLVTYVPDKVFTPLIKNLHADSDFLTFATAREEEALGIVSGAWMGGLRGAVLMQTSGFGTIPNVLASLIVPYQVPAIMFVAARSANSISARRWCAAPCARCWRRLLSNPTPSPAMTNSNSSSTARSSKPWRHRPPSPLFCRRCSPAAKCSKAEREILF
jgi:hypothetical protein